EAQRIKPTLYDGIVISKKHNVISVGDSEETLILEEKSRSKMLTKQNDPNLNEKKVNISPINYSELNKLSEDFEKRFVPQKQLSAKQAFWLPLSNPISKQLVVPHTPLKIEVSKELSKVRLVNKSFQKLKNHLANFDKVVKVIITPTTITEGGWGFEHTKKVFLEEVIPFINSLREPFKDFDNGLHNELNEVKTVFNQMEAAVEQCSEFFKINEWQAKLNAKDVLIANLRKHVESLKGKNVVEKDVQPNNANVIAPGMFRLDLEPLAPRSEHARALIPLDSDLDSACKYAKRIQEVLVYVTDTCPSLSKTNETLVVVTSLNKNKKVRWSKSSSGTVIFGNDQIANNMVYGDYQMGNVMISRVYYVEGSGHKLFSVGQVCDLNLEVAFHKHTCYIRDLEGVNLLKGSRGLNLYTLSMENMMLSSLICLLSKASKTKFWLWHQRVFEDIHDLRSVETEFPAIDFNDEVSSKTLSYEPTVCSLNDEIDFRISFDKSDDEDYTIICEKNSFSYKMISVNNLKMNSENDNEKVMPSIPSPEPGISCFDDLDFFKDFENEFPAIVYNDVQTSKSELLTEPTLNPQHIDEFNLNDETSMSEYDEEEQNILYFNNLFPFNIILPEDLKLEKDNDDNDIDITRSLLDNEIIHGPIRSIHQGRYGVSALQNHQRPQKKKANTLISREIHYVVFKIWNQYNILEDIKRGPYSKKSPIRRIQLLRIRRIDPT
ncbi:hypothetical protein Tco_1492969, partial [Tanacetum coccineum]